jgi:hypothetical protein
MSQTVRQNNLFVAQDWTVIYQAMSQVNFNSYDYDTIRQSLIEYIRTNYPEDFNDWISSSEFVAIIEMLAYLGANLAFRVDLNTRENFLSTATRRESLLRLARFLSYNPRRCLAAQGLLKLTQIKTTQTIYDSNGVNLQNLTVNWNDTGNPDWLEQFILILNAAFQPSNPFGQPVKSGTVGSVATERYDFNNTDTNNLSYKFNSTVNGTSMDMEFVNSDFVAGTSTGSTLSSNGYYMEKIPNIFNSWSLLYRRDGNGNASVNTGFFTVFKQGTLDYSDYNLGTPVPNRVIDVGALNINQNDVWVQTVSDAGLPLLDWTKVPAIVNSNLVYNNVERLTRDIYQVVTRDSNGSDSISIRFGDGNFGNVPVGRVRVYYRTSNNLTYVIQPQDMNAITLSLSYQSELDTLQTLTMQFSLQYPVANSLARESDDSIRLRAPAVYYTQNRMVNGEDYNVFPLQNSQVLKLKSVNRVYSGQSRFLDITDPTSKYSRTQVFSDDGILYKQIVNTSQQIPLINNLNTNQIIESIIQPLLHGGTDIQNVNIALRDFYLSYYTWLPGGGIFWRPSGSSLPNASQGLFYAQSNNTPTGEGTAVYLPNLERGLTTGSLVQFTEGGWASVVNQGSSELGIYATIISKPIGEYLLGSSTQRNVALQIIPPLRVSLSTSEKDDISNALQSKRNFGLRYNIQTLTWQVIDSQDLAINAPFNLANTGNTSKSNVDASWLVQFLYQANSGWQITMRGLHYMFESVREVQFYFLNNHPVVDNVTLTSARDNIRILKYNTGSNNQQLTTDQYWALHNISTSIDGQIDPRIVRVVFWDSNNDNIIDNPLVFEDLVPPNSLVFWKSSVAEGSQIWQPIPGVDYIVTFLADLSTTVPVPSVGNIAYVTNPGVFLECVSINPLSWKDVSTNYKALVGKSHINYCWQHYANSQKRIDPAIMNVIDAYVLTNNYNTALRNWISKSRPTDTQPQPPTPEDLRTLFQEFDSYKMMTDQIIWHPVRYKLLFGNLADPQLQAIFKIVRISGSTITDRELKARVIQAVDTFFDIANWDFGQSFYFTELAAYVHQQMANLLSSVVIVPTSSNSQFGDLFEIKCEPDQLFISAARVTDVQVVQNLYPSELRINT